MNLVNRVRAGTILASNPTGSRTTRQPIPHLRPDSRALERLRRMQEAVIVRPSILSESQKNPPHILSAQPGLTVAEFRPQIITVWLENGPGYRSVFREMVGPKLTKETGRYSFRLALPFLYVVITAKARYLYFRQTRVQQPEQPRLSGVHFGLPPLPNIFDNGQLCEGNIRAISEIACLRCSAELKAKHIARVWWSSIFHAGAGSNGNFQHWAERCPQLRTYTHWEAATQARPPFVLDIPWTSHAVTLSSLGLAVD